MLARNVLFYHAAPLVAAGLWKQEDLGRMETTMYRKIYGISNTISSDVLIHVLQNKEPIWRALHKFALKSRRLSLRNEDIRGYFNPKAASLDGRSKED